MIETRKFLLAWLLLFVAWMAGSFVVHGSLLAADYDALVSSGMFRAPQQAQPLLPLMLLAHVLLAGALVWIYSRGRNDGPWPGQGLRFGIAVALLTIVLGLLVAWFLRQPLRAA